MWVFGMASVGGLAAGFATLAASMDGLTIKSPLAGAFKFEPHEVVSLEVKGSKLSGRYLFQFERRTDND